MPRNMSFTLTTEQVKTHTKTVTRRAGWTFLKPGDLLWACKQCQGLKKGEKVERLALIRVVSVRRESLWNISVEDVFREGFTMGPLQFAEFYVKHNGGLLNQPVTRIEFEYAEGQS